MALLADRSGDVYSNIVNNNDASVTFTVPGDVILAVESVAATVDNAAGGNAATLTLTITDSAGEVIAKIPQASTIPVGDTGTATWALRLSGDRTTATSAGPIETFSLNAVSIGVGVTTFLTFAHASGSALTDLTTPTTPKLLAAGQYAFCGVVHAFPSPPAATTGFFHFIANMGAGGVDDPFAFKQAIEDVIWPGTTNDAYRAFACVWRASANNILDLPVTNHLNAARFFEAYAVLQRLD
jgi:hypothetical protein